MEGSKKCAEYLLTKNVKRCMNEIKKAMDFLWQIYR